MRLIIGILIVTALLASIARHHDRPEALIDNVTAKKVDADYQRCETVRTGPIAPLRPVNPYARKKDVA